MTAPLPPDVPACMCASCREACRRPCWPTTAEAAALIDAGLGGRLMLDFWAADDEHPAGIKLLCPACPGHEGDTAPFAPFGGCTFQAVGTGLCELHDRGLKPAEGRKTGCGKVKKSTSLHRIIAETWATPEGAAVVERWDAEYEPCPQPEPSLFDAFQLMCR